MAGINPLSGGLPRAPAQQAGSPASSGSAVDARIDAFARPLTTGQPALAQGRPQASAPSERPFAGRAGAFPTTAIWTKALVRAALGKRSLPVTIPVEGQGSENRVPTVA